MIRRLIARIRSWSTPREEVYSAAEYCEGALSDVVNRARIDRFYARFERSRSAPVRTWDRRWRSFFLGERIRGEPKPSKPPKPPKLAESTFYVGE